jgi:hypothetical protein
LRRLITNSIWLYWIFILASWKVLEVRYNNILSLGCVHNRLYCLLQYSPPPPSPQWPCFHVCLFSRLSPCFVYDRVSISLILSLSSSLLCSTIQEIITWKWGHSGRSAINSTVYYSTQVFLYCTLYIGLPLTRKIRAKNCDFQHLGLCPKVKIIDWD